jgi:hypothetical protein
MAKLKFGSPAWRKKYMKTNRPKRKAKAKHKSTAHSRGTRHKKTRMREMIRERGNPPSSWTKVKAFRVVRKNGRKVLEVKK